MVQCGDGDSASLYALGLLDESESLAFEAHLSTCASCEAALRESGELAVDLARTIPLAFPPASLRQRVLTQATLPRGVAALARGEHLDWRPTPFPGVSMARLFEDPVRGERASLLRIAPGAYIPSHHHAAVEHCYVIEGDLVFEDHALRAGDYAASVPDEDHSAATTKAGCLLFIVHNERDRVHSG
jgi:anti-sigma factor ChrR (cupin superfamily)